MMITTKRVIAQNRFIFDRNCNPIVQADFIIYRFVTFWKGKLAKGFIKIYDGQENAKKEVEKAFKTGDLARFIRLEII